MIVDGELSAEAGRWCSLASLAAGEQLFGTATRVTVWLALEHDANFGAEALADSALPDAVKAHFAGALAAIPGSRVQLIRQPGRLPRSAAARTFFVALPGALYRFLLDDVLDLTRLDVQAVVNRDARFAPNQVAGTLWLVCVNGRRDRCCAKFGGPFYDALRLEAGAWVWQTSHVGGHRFAPTVVALPHGLIYGRVPSNKAAALAHDQSQRRIALDFYRGCSYDDEPVQAAEYYLRRETGILGIDALARLAVVRQGDGRWRAQFEALHEPGVRYEVIVESAPSTFAIAKSCADESSKPVAQHHLVGLRRLV